MESDQEFALFHSVFRSSIDSTGVAGSLISDSEASSLATVRPASDLIYSENLGAFVARWNRSQDYYARGYFQPSDLPPALALNSDMINFTYIDEKAAFLRNATLAALRRGFNDIYDLWLADKEALETACSRVDEGVCASVRVQIKQRAVLTRDAFEAELQIQNSGLDMTNITITLSITNRDSSRSANNLFVLSSPTLIGITSVDGEGTLAGSISGSASWLILALSDAAPTVPTYYNIGGKFEYYQDGVPTSITMNPDTILVSPDPQLDLLYFHEYDIFGDDPFTPAIEPPVPYKLAVLVKNSGYGDAKGLRIMSGQPEIIDNEKGLLVDFKIISAELAGQPAQPSLEIDFGTVPARSSKVGVWTLTSTLQGTFSNYNATFTYKGPLNDERLALIKSVQIYKLSRYVFIDSAAEDGRRLGDSLPAFLIDKLPDIDRIPDTLISSYQGTEYPVFATIGGTIVRSESVVGESFTHRMVVNMSLPDVPLPLASQNGNWFYFQFNDTLPSSYDLQSVLREGTGRYFMVRMFGARPRHGGLLELVKCRKDTSIFWTLDLPLVFMNCVSVRLEPTTLSPTAQPTTQAPTQEPTTQAPTAQPTTLAPTAQPTTLAPTAAPTQEPTTLAPTAAPTQEPTTLAPTAAPTQEPTTLAPTAAPTQEPTTLAPTAAPTQEPTTLAPTEAPTLTPTAAPTQEPTTLAPTAAPTQEPTTLAPTAAPTQEPTTLAPTASPTQEPTPLAPTEAPTLTPTAAPTQEPTTLAPTASPTQEPTTLAPTEAPTLTPTAAPTQEPTTLAPTAAPTQEPTTLAPTEAPTAQPTTLAPTAAPTQEPTTLAPTAAPTQEPTTLAPTAAPTQEPTTWSPTERPTTRSPTGRPTTRSPTGRPTTRATNDPFSNTETNDPFSNTETDDAISNRETNDPFSNTETNDPISNWATDDPVSNWATNDPISNRATNDPISNWATNDPISNWATNDPISHI
ncbi:Coagulation factor 5/8 C-terminal domain [Fragilaria crotonensis]|nr:Coagulation factor 5/8 C-terminal domain [Fragilaria crotonensis]